MQGVVVPERVGKVASHRSDECAAKHGFDLTSVSAESPAGVTPLTLLDASQTQALSALDTLVEGLAHDMKNPLAAIRTFVQLVRHKHNDHQFLIKFERIVLQQLDRINRMIEELLRLERPARADRAAVDVVAIVQQVLEVYVEYAQQRHIVLKMDVATGLPPLVADAELLNRAFANILLNAVEAMPQGGTLFIACRPVFKSEVEIVFKDTGVGIAPEQLDTLFRPFETGKSSGTGLGLPLTRKMIEAHGGRIHIASQVGRGTVVTVTLPSC